MKRYSEICVGKYDRDRAQKLALRINRSPYFSQLLINRGIDTNAKYLQWSLCKESFLNSPWLLPDMRKAVDILASALEKDQLIFICGDYDSDGINAVTVMVRGLQALNAQVEYMLPNRSDGYGLNMREIARAEELGASVLVTVDCGSSNIQEVKVARAKGLQVIVTDHHEVPDIWPEAEAFINPMRPDSQYPDPHICGTTVAWKVIDALYLHLNKPEPFNLLDFVGFATITDMMPLIGENRILGRLGINLIERWNRSCMRALGCISNVINRPLNAKSISFFMGPRVNAVGRIDDPAKCLEMFLSDDPQFCQKRALFIEECNTNRRNIQDEIIREIKENIALSQAKRQGFIFSCGNWPSGIVGIVAGQLMNDYLLPCLIAHEKDGIISGSGRTPIGTNLRKILNDCREHLLTFGGHASAAGFSLKKENLSSFLQQFSKSLAIHKRPIPPKFVDYEIALDAINIKLVYELKELEPTGQEAPSPCFLIRKVRFSDMRPIKEGQYFTGYLVQDGISSTKIKAMFFATSSYDIRNYNLFDEVCDVVISLDIDNFQGRENVCACIDYIIASDSKQLNRINAEEGLPIDEKVDESAFKPIEPYEDYPVTTALSEEARLEFIKQWNNFGKFSNILDKKVPESSLLSKDQTPVDKSEGFEGNFNADMLSKDDEYRKPNGAEDNIRLSTPLLLDARDRNSDGYISQIIKNLQARGMKCSPQDLLAVTAYARPLEKLLPNVLPAISCIEWRKFMESGLQSDVGDIFLLDIPLDLDSLRSSGILSKVSRIHLLYSTKSESSLRKQLENFSLNGSLMDKLWNKVDTTLRESDGDFIRTLAELESIWQFNSTKIRVALIAFEELNLISTRYLEGRWSISHHQKFDGDKYPIIWENSSTFKRLSRLLSKFEQSCQLLKQANFKAGICQNTELIWK